MVERLDCKTLGCAGNIHPDTAAKTGGYCMPCARKAELAQARTRVEPERQAIDDFAGVSDTVEIVRRLHQRHVFDASIDRAPCPIPTPKLYRMLTSPEQERVIDLAIEAIEADDDVADDYLRNLSCFCDAKLDRAHEKMLAKGVYYPGVVFRGASSETITQLISALDKDESNHKHALCALAWAGTAQVADVFARWRAHPPPWTAKLYVLPHLYAYEAGWELDEHGARRDLHFAECWGLDPGSSPEPERFRAFDQHTDTCDACSRPLLDLFAYTDLASTGPSTGLLSSTLPHQLRVRTCLACSDYHTVYARFDDQGNAQLALEHNEQDSDADGPETYDFPTDCLQIGSRRGPYVAASEALQVSFSQLGGHPTWVHDAEYPSCPQCSRTMMFVAQAAYEDIEPYGEGLVYAFVCSECRMTATGYQQS